MTATELIKIYKRGNMSKGNREGINLFLRRFGYIWRKEKRQMEAMPDVEIHEIWVLRSKDGRELDTLQALAEIRSAGG